MISSMSVPICNRFQATQANNGKITTFTEVAIFDAHLLELRVSGLGLLKSTSNGENLIQKLSWHISSHFVAIQC